MIFENICICIPTPQHLKCHPNHIRYFVTRQNENIIHVNNDCKHVQQIIIIINSQDIFDINGNTLNPKYMYEIPNTQIILVFLAYYDIMLAFITK